MWYIKWRHLRGHNSGLTLVQGARGQEWVRCLLTTSKSPLQTNYHRGCHTHQVSYPGCPEGSPPWAHRSYATGTHSGFLKIFSLCSWSSPYSAPREVVGPSAIGIWSASSCKVLPITMNGYTLLDQRSLPFLCDWIQAPSSVATFWARCGIRLLGSSARTEVVSSEI